MSKSTKLLLALSVALKAAGGGVAAGNTIDGDLASTVARCAYYSELDRVGLQTALEELLETSPDDDCISFIVDLLGGAPLAQASSGLGEGSQDSAARDDDDSEGAANFPFLNEVYP